MAIPCEFGPIIRAPRVEVNAWYGVRALAVLLEVATIQEPAIRFRRWLVATSSTPLLFGN